MRLGFFAVCAANTHTRMSLFIQTGRFGVSCDFDGVPTVITWKIFKLLLQNLDSFSRINLIKTH